MHDLYKVKEMLVNELKEFGKKGDLSKPSLDAINKLAHAAKNVCKVIDYCEQDECDYSTTYRDSYTVKSRPIVGEATKIYLRDLLNSGSDDRLREELRRMVESF